MNPYLYILMRTDLASMSTGRAAAQASHAANAFVHKYGRLKEVKKWQKATTQGFGTAIVLSATKDILIKAFSHAESMRNKIFIVGDEVIDPDYCFPVTPEVFTLIDRTMINGIISETPERVIISKKEITCGYLFGDKEDLKPIIGHLPLYP